MGLAEKRAVAEYQEKTFPAAIKQIEEAAGTAIPVEPKWDSFLATDPSGTSIDAGFQAIYIKPLVGALKSVASDDMGKKALKSELKKIVLDGSSGYSTNGFTFNGGTLTLQHQLFQNMDDVQERTDAIKKLLEDKL